MQTYGRARLKRLKRIKKWKRHRVFAQRRLTFICFCMGLVWLYAGITATKGAVICYGMAAACFWATSQEYKDIKCFKKAVKGSD